ncbi:MAG: alpha-amylase [Muribaculaceae bacterium]|nr:alpha-amylase [Muribaculaceae bacterium]
MKFGKLATVLSILSVTFAAVACGSENDGPDSPAVPDTPAEATAARSNIVYQVNPRFYGEGDCLKKVTADIPRIASMGCDVLWVMPVYELGQKNSIGSPYCIKDYKQVSSHLGSNDDLKTLVSTAHANGMKVILDWVANHTAWDHVWTETNPERYKKDANGNIASTPMWGDVAQLDYNVASTREGMKDAMIYWVNTADVDGFRCDYAEGVPHTFWKDVIAELKKIDPNIIMLAETSQTAFYDDGFDMVYDWNFPSNAKTLFGGGKTSNMINYITESNAKVPEGKTIMRYAFNHDVASENDVARMYATPEGTRAAYVIAVFSGGTPMIYSSMDVEGLSGKLSFFNHRDLKFSETLTSEYKAINNAFKQTAVARGGKFRSYANTDAVMMAWENGKKTVLVAVNPTAQAKNVKTPIALTGEEMTDLISGSTKKLGATMDIPAYGYLIFSR